MNTWKQQLAKTPKMPTPEHMKVKLLGEWDECPTDKVLYVHYRADDGLPYYVGYGIPKRPTDVGKKDRNDDWHEVNDAHGLRVEVKLTGLHEHVANIIETWWIYSYRQKFGRYSEGGTMVNKSSGGGCGATGSKRNAEQLERHRAVMKIAANRPEFKAKLSAATTGELNPMYGRKHSEEIRAVVSAAQTGKLGEQCNTFKGYSVGVNAEQFVILAGTKEIEECEFHQGSISACILGRPNRNSHKGFTWTRQNTLNYQDFLHLKPFNELSRDRVIDAIPEEFHAHLMALDGKDFLAYALFN